MSDLSGRLSGSQAISGSLSGGSVLRGGLSMGGGVSPELLLDKADVITDTASGSIVNFPDGMASPVLGLSVDIEPIQDLHGYDNPWPAGGGTNRWDEEWELGYYDSGGVPQSSTTNIRCKNPISVSPSTTYYGKGNPMYVCEFRSDNSFIKRTQVVNTTFTTDQDCAYIKFNMGSAYGATYNHDIAINYPSTITTYSPYSNLCPISGRSEVKVTRTGKNLLGGLALGNAIVNAINNETASKFDSDENGNFVTIKAGAAVSDKPFTGGIKFKESTQYTLILRLTRYQTGTNLNSNIQIVYTDNTRTSITFTPASNTDVVTIAVTSTASKTIKDVMTLYGGGTTRLFYEDSGIFEGVLTASGFEPYSGTTHTIPLGQTVYGGTLDVTEGKLVITMGSVTLNGSETWVKSGGQGYYTQRNDIKKQNDYTGAILCDKLPTFSRYSTSEFMSAINGITAYSSSTAYLGQNWFYAKANGAETANDFKAWLADNPLTVVYELATPVEVTLTPQELDILFGDNNIWADSGDTTVEYRADTKLWILKKIAQALNS